MLRHATGYKLANDGQRHARAAALPRPQEHHAHRALHRALAGAVQEFLGGLSARDRHAGARKPLAGSGERSELEPGAAVTRRAPNPFEGLSEQRHA